MGEVLVFALMFMSAGLPLVLSTYWMKRGKVGYTLTLFSVLLAGFIIGMFIIARILATYTVKITGVTLLVFLPGLLGCMAGALLGWLIYRRRYG